jgi:glutaredoxin
MKACENHKDSIVIFNGGSCPFCKVAKSLKTIGEEIEKSMAIMKQLKVDAEEAGLKSE